MNDHNQHFPQDLQQGLQIEWWGTAAFRIQYGKTIFLLDPYITRNPFSNPKLNVSFESAAQNAQHIFISHAHFDHVVDIPRFLALNTSLNVWAPPTAARHIKRDCKNDDRTARIHVIHSGPVLSHGDVLAEAFESKHVQFDTRLIATTTARIARSLHMKKYVYPSLITHYNCGETLSWVFSFGGYRIRFLGSAGPTEEMLLKWSKTQDDCLLVPVQGNTKICEIAAHIVEKLNPKIVIPHHFDDFYPPISQFIDLSTFRSIVQKRAPRTRIVELGVGERIHLTGGNSLRQGLRDVQGRQDSKDHIAPS